MVAPILSMYTENGPTIKEGNKLRPHFVYHFSEHNLGENDVINPIKEVSHKCLASGVFTA